LLDGEGNSVFYEPGSSLQRSQNSVLHLAFNTLTLFLWYF